MFTFLLLQISSWDPALSNTTDVRSDALYSITLEREAFEEEQAVIQLLADQVLILDE